jgi:hypothetical protein
MYQTLMPSHEGMKGPMNHDRPDSPVIWSQTSMKVALPFGSASRQFISREAWEDVSDKKRIFIMVHHR